MSPLETCRILVSVPVLFVTAGYGWTARLDGSAQLRLATAILAGLASLVFSVSIVNAAAPIAGVWAWVCFLPWLSPFIRRAVREQFVADVRTVATPRTALIHFGMAAFLAALLWPMLSRSDLVFYDGSANHDAFLWIVNAEHLRQSSYLVGPVPDPAHPLLYPAAVITGIAPVWGRMGAEGLLALFSSLFGMAPLNLYVVATAALFVPWLAAVYLMVRTFFSAQPFGIVALAVILLQPVFVFFHANANLPNLVAVLSAGLFLVALARSLRGAGDWARWCLLTPIAGHAVLCAYPEALPVVALSALCLMVPSLWTRRRQGGVRLAWTISAALAGLAINPLTSIRATHGFMTSLRVLADPDVQRPNILHHIALSARVPALATLSVPLGHDLSWPLLGIGCTAALAVAAAFGLRNAQDRLGAVAVLAGVPLMVGLTVIEGVGYGWQKTVQFSAVPIAALFLAAAVAPINGGARSRAVRSAARLVAVVVVLLFAYATAANLREAYKWSQRKFITREWFAARDYSETKLRNATIEVDARNFDYPFFYTMWSAYFLTGSRVQYVGERASGGYLRAHLDPHADEWFAPARAAFVSRHAIAATTETPLWRGAQIGFIAPQAQRTSGK